MTVSEQDVVHVAELANLELNTSEKISMLRDLNALLDHFAQLNELDTTAITPMSQVAQGPSPEGATHLRPDELAPSLDRELVLSCAPDTDCIFFKVPKVIER